MGTRCFVCLTLLLSVAYAGTNPARRHSRGRQTPPATAAVANPLAAEIESSTNLESVRAGTSGPRVVRAQILLDNARFSPGEIDGRYGDDLGIAIRGYQGKNNLNPTGVIDDQTWQSLNANAGSVLTTYTITNADEKGPFQPIPREPQERAKMKVMGYTSPKEELAEKFHLSQDLLAKLNPGAKFDTAGETITVPNVRRGIAHRAAKVVVSKSQRTVSAYAANGDLLAQYPATIGGPHDPLPIGDWKIVSVVHKPWFNYNPVHFWNANPHDAVAILPPGPRNP